MTDAVDHNGMGEAELLAAELALGVLSRAERASAQARAAQDAAFARLVATWEERLAPWAGEADEVAPPAHVWSGIAAQLPRERSRTGLWESMRFWRIFALASFLVAACLALFIVLNPARQQEPLIASIEGGGHRHFVATIDAARGTIAVVPAAFAADPSRVPELWLIPADGKPRSLGLLSADRTVTLGLPPQLAGEARRNAALAVSLEPPGGSPTGLPTGPVIASGALTSL